MHHSNVRPIVRVAMFDPDGPSSPTDGIFGLDTSEEESQVVLLPIPYEATVSFGCGTAEAPKAIHRASHQIDLFDLDTGYPYQKGIVMRPIPMRLLDLNRRAAACVEIARDPQTEDRTAAREQVNQASAELNRYTFEQTKALLEQKKIVGIVGGEHSVSFGALRAHAEQGEFGILQIDAHADLREAYEGFRFSHASIMERVLAEIPQVNRLIQVGVRDLCPQEMEAIIGAKGRVETVFDPALSFARMNSQLTTLFAKTAALLPDRVYVSFDIDGLDPSLCPKTGTPVPGGLTFAEVFLLVEQIVSSGKQIIGFDLCEVGGAEWDANVGARVLYKLIGWTLESRSPIFAEHRKSLRAGPFH